MSRTNYYRRPATQAAKDAADVATLERAHFVHPFYGTRRLALHLGWSRKKARRIRNLAGVVIDPPAKSRRYKGSRADISAPPNILHRYATFRNESRPQDGMDYSDMVNAHAWVQDFTYLWFDRHMHYLAIVLDLKTRQVVGWRLAALLDALSKHPTPTILHSDQGSEYLSYKHQEICEHMGIQLSASAKASPWQNGFMERWFGNFKLELGGISHYKDVAELHEAIALQIHYYNYERIHSALKMSPAAYAAGLKARESSDKVLQKTGP